MSTVIYDTPYIYQDGAWTTYRKSYWLASSSAWSNIREFVYAENPLTGLPGWALMAVPPPVVIPAGFPTLTSTGWKAGTSPPSSLVTYPGSNIAQYTPSSVVNLSGKLFDYVSITNAAAAGSSIFNSKMICDKNHGGIIASQTCEFGFCTVGDIFTPQAGNGGYTQAAYPNMPHIHDCQIVYQIDGYHIDGACLFEKNYVGAPQPASGVQGGGTHNDVLQSTSNAVITNGANVRNNTLLGYDQYGGFINDAIWHFGGATFTGGATPDLAIRFTGNFCSGASRVIAAGTAVTGMIVRGNTIDFWIGPNGRAQPKLSLWILAASNLYPIGTDHSAAPASSWIEEPADWDESDYDSQFNYWVQDNVRGDTGDLITISQAAQLASAW